MPIYAYKCKACAYEADFVQKISEELISRCPKCKKQKLERVIGPTGFILKGDNWFSKSGKY